MDLAHASVTVHYNELGGRVVCTFTNGRACPALGVVVAEPVNRLTIVAPYLALFGVIATIAVVVAKKVGCGAQQSCIV